MDVARRDLVRQDVCRTARTKWSAEAYGLPPWLCAAREDAARRARMPSTGGPRAMCGSGSGASVRRINGDTCWLLHLPTPDDYPTRTFSVVRGGGAERGGEADGAALGCVAD